jgi:hypothetical protein
MPNNQTTSHPLSLERVNVTLHPGGGHLIGIESFLQGRRREAALAASLLGATLIVAGMFDDTLALGGTAKPITSVGALDAWVAKLDASGDGVWAVRFGGAGDDRDPKLAIDAAGDIYVAGSFQNQVAFGAVNLISKGLADIFIAKLHGNDGSVVWAVSLGSVNNDGVGDIAVDAAGHVVIVASVGGAIDGGTSLGGVDSVVASFDGATGTSRWRQVYSTDRDDRASASPTGATATSTRASGSVARSTSVCRSSARRRPRRCCCGSRRSPGAGR